MTFNPNLFLTKESELMIERWKQRDPHDIVAECMGLTRGASVVDSDGLILSSSSSSSFLSLLLLLFVSFLFRSRFHCHLFWIVLIVAFSN